MIVLPIKSKETYPWLLKKHYAKRIPSISYAFGLYDEIELVGVCTYGTPSSSALREGVAGPENAEYVLELNRLCIDSKNKNAASILVGRSLKMLPNPSIVVSYADTDQSHVGYVYQACNFIYTGLSAKRTDWKVKGLENLHGLTIGDMSRGCEGSRVEWMREKFGEDFYLEQRPRKHRYIYITGKNKSLKSAIKYQQEPFPKGESKRYDSGGSVQIQSLLFISKPMIFQKRKYFRSKNHLLKVASLPCQLCGVQGQSQAAHSNWSQWGGKGKSIKSSDEFTAALCLDCHYKIDQGSKWSRDQRKEAWTLAHIRTVQQLTESNQWPVDIPIPDIGQ